MNADSKVILVAEDDDNNFYLLDFLLQSFNCKVIRAYNGLEAVDIFKSRNDISLIFMDMRMPEMNGLESSKIIKSLNSKVPIIIATAFAYNELEKYTFEKISEKIILKPFTQEIVKNILEEFINT